MTDDAGTDVLLVEDNDGDARLIELGLAEERRDGVRPFALHRADRLAAALERVRAGGVDVVLLDLNLPDSAGYDTFLRVRAAVPDVPVVVLSGLADEELGARAVREGAQDYLVKGQSPGPVLARSIA